ncbi:MAG: transcriptional regulator [Chloroflexi bacterium]|nr:transcriptional regulator [Chloroflexota bacterium]
MTDLRTPAGIASLVRELCALPAETEWVEFKVNQSNPQVIGEYLSALANGAALNGKPAGYLVWGVEDGTHRVVGTRFTPSRRKKGNEPLEAWLLRMLTPRLDFRFREASVNGCRVVLLEMDAARAQPVAFAGTEFVRIGGVKKRLREYPEKERALWRTFDRAPFESGLAAEGLNDAEVVRLLDCPAYFRRLGLPMPASRRAVLTAITQDKLIRRAAGGWAITNLGAILLANRLRDFARLGRKALRIIRYAGSRRTSAAREWEFSSGYAVSFDRVEEHLDALLPSREVLDGARRRTEWAFPPTAVRELVANALIHQDLEVTGAGPMVEIFDRRMEITNPGEPLVATDRFVDAAPQSRNEALASLMRRFEFCEERGVGIDRVVELVEAFQMPAPSFQKPGGFTRVILYGRKELKEMSAAERVWACYLHACLRYVGGEFLTNTSLRGRFGVAEKNRAMISRIIRQAVRERAVVPVDASSGPKTMKYIPFWAAPDAVNGG